MKKKENITISISKQLKETIDENNPMNMSLFLEEIIYYGLEVYKKKKEVGEKLKNIAIENMNLDNLDLKSFLSEEKKKRK